MAGDFPKRLVLSQRQWVLLRELLAAILPANRFYAAKLRPETVTRLASIKEFCEQVPFTTKAELAADQTAHPPYGSNLTYPLERYSRCHQTSGTAGAPLRWLDTPESWNWMLANWTQVFGPAGGTCADRVFFAFSFGPFIGFWRPFSPS